MRAMGFEKDPLDLRDRKFQYTLPAQFMKVLPPKESCRDLMPPAYDQDGMNDCVGEATKRLIAHAHRKQGKIDPVLSSMMIWYTARTMEMTSAKNVGCSPRDALKGAANIGVCTEKLWPFDPKKYAVRPGWLAYWNAYHERILSYHQVVQIEQYLKACIAEGYPFSVGIVVCENFPQETTTGAIPMPAGNVLGGHDIVIDGYEPGYWHFYNSWGEWGDHGPGTLPWEYLLNPEMASSFWTIRMVA
jgi:hypothetical protein